MVNRFTVTEDVGGRFAIRSNYFLSRSALVIIGAQVFSLCLFVSTTWFKHDDFVILFRTTSEGGFPGSLFTVNGGHLLPGVVFLYWVLRSIFGMQWWPFVAVIAGAQAAASYLTWRVLKSFFGLRPVSVLLLLVYCASVLTLSANMWAIAAIQYLPLQIAFPATVLLLQRYMKHQNFQMSFLTIIPVLVATLFFEKALMIVPFVVVLCAITPLSKYCSDSWNGRLRELRSPLGLMFAMTVAYGLIVQIVTQDSSGKANFTLRALSNFDLAPLTGNLWTSLLGGPGTFSTNGWLSSPAPLEINFSLFAVTMLFLWSIIRDWRAIKYWIFLISMACANVTLIALADRTYAQLTPRYMSDIVFPMVLLIGFASLGNSNDVREGISSTAKRISRLSTPMRLGLVIFVGTMILAHTAKSQLALVAAMKFAPGESYVERARRTAIAATEAPTLIPHPVPSDVIGPIWGLSGENTTRTLLTPADLHIRFGTVVENPFMVLADGNIVPARFDSISKPVPTASQCLNQEEVSDSTLEMDTSPIVWSWYVRLRYTTINRSTADLVWSGPNVIVELYPGSHTVFFPIVGGGNTLTVASGSRGVCVEEIEIVQLKLDN